jgi:hypothetical protein
MRSTQPSATLKSTPTAASTAENYMLHFYPLWFSYSLSQRVPHNRFIGPDRISPIFRSATGVNDDTLYAIAFLNLSVEPIILTIPQTSATYSILTLDAYGDVFASGIPAQTSATFALVGSTFSGELPPGITPIVMPLDLSIMIFRADKFSSSGDSQIAEAEPFRTSLVTAALSAYQKSPQTPGSANDAEGGNTLILPEVAFAHSFKLEADDLIASAPIEFLKQLQAAVASPLTPPLSSEEEILSDEFNRLFDDSEAHAKQLASGARNAFTAIVSDYFTHKIAGTEWIHFTNIGNWGDALVDRAAMAEFFIYANDISTAAYYHTFHDGDGAPLDGRRGCYVLTFPAGSLPQAKRFWSLTAYTPETIELIENPAKKYVVASYTPGLKTNADGSVSIYMAQEIPAGVEAANWLPVSSMAFNILLRVYGPEGDVANDTFVPPAIEKLQ